MTASSTAHQKRIHQVLDYIEAHLEDNLSLETLSGLAHYSPFHFHRIFKMVTGETPNGYVKRKRIEKAASVLLRKKDITISELSFRYSFTSNSSFTRAFKSFYGLSPTDFRRKSKGTYSKISQMNRKNGQAITKFDAYVCTTKPLQKDTLMTDHISVATKTPISFVGIPFIGKHNSNQAFEKLLNWAGSHGLLRTPNFKMASIFYDSLKITSEANVRMSAGLLVEQPVEMDDTVAMVHFPESNYIIGHFEIGMDQFEASWTSLFMYMNANGYKKSDQPVFQLYHNNYNEHPEKKCIVDLYIPVT